MKADKKRIMNYSIGAIVSILMIMVMIGLPQPTTISTWDGEAGNGLWSDPVNWSGDVLPSSTSEVILGGTGAVVTLDIDFTLEDGGKLKVGGFGAHGDTLVVDAGRTLTFNNAGQSQNIVERDGTISVFGTVDVLTGFNAQLFGNFIVEPSGVLNIGLPGALATMNAAGTYDDETLVNNGVVNLNGYLNISSIVTNNGTFNSNESIIKVRGLANYGTFVNTAGGIFIGSGGRIEIGDSRYSSLDNLVNEGTFTYEGLTKLYELITNSGSMDLTGGTLDVACGGNIKNTGTLTLGTVNESCKQWDGDAGDGLWSTPENWSMDSLPDSTDRITIGEMYPLGQEVHLDIDFEVGSGKMLENLGASRSEPVQGTFYIDAGVTLTISGVVKNMYGQLVNNGTIINNGTLESRGHPNVNTAIFDNNGLLTNNGTVNNAGSPYDTSTNVENYGFFNNYGTLNNYSALNNINGTFTSSFAVIDNPGTISNRSLMELECTDLTGNPVVGNPPTIIGDKITYYQDADADGYGNGSVSIEACSVSAGYVENSTDCNDADVNINTDASEVCDGVDNDCDGSIDEDYIPIYTTCGTGQCAATGQTQCVNGTESDTCTVGRAAADDSICDGIDNDCDGSIDEDYVPVATSCGTGQCSATGQTQCVNGTESDTCTVGRAAADDSICDGIDNDCDGSVDEDYVPIATSCGTGSCTSTGATLCVSGEIVDTCAEGTPSEELCDGADNDCNGQVDDGLTSDVDNDGHTSLDSCEGTKDDCDDSSPNRFPDNAEVCDGIDNNCNASVDEGIYTFRGFQQPINDNGSSIFKVGRTIPVKIVLTDCTGQNTTDSSVTISIYRISNAVIGTEEELDIVSSGEANTGNLFRVEDGKYIYNMSTKSYSKGTYRIYARPDDGSSYSTIISLK